MSEATDALQKITAENIKKDTMEHMRAVKQLSKWGMTCSFSAAEKPLGETWSVALTFRQSGNTLDEAVELMQKAIQGSIVKDNE